MLRKTLPHILRYLGTSSNSIFCLHEVKKLDSETIGLIITFAFMTLFSLFPYKINFENPNAYFYRFRF